MEQSMTGTRRRDRNSDVQLWAKTKLTEMERENGDGPVIYWNIHKKSGAKLQWIGIQEMARDIEDDKKCAGKMSWNELSNTVIKINLTQLNGLQRLTSKLVK